MHTTEELVVQLLKLFNHLMTDINRLENLIMATQDELATQLSELNTSLSNVILQIDKVKLEIQNATQAQVDAIAALQEQLVNASQVSPEVQAAFDTVLQTSVALTAVVQTMDDINPDAPAPV